MKGIGKKVVVASKPEGRGILLKGLADETFGFHKNNKMFVCSLFLGCSRTSVLDIKTLMSLKRN